MKSLFLILIRFYQVAIFPFLGERCRYYPSCSHYGLEAIEKYGAFKGGWLTVKRICRCTPFHRGGSDPVP